MLSGTLNLAQPTNQRVCFQHRHKPVNMITREPLHLAWWNFARMCASTTSGNLLNINLKSCGFLCISFMRDTAWTVWCGFMKCYSLDGATLFLPAEATGAIRVQYLALSKARQSCPSLLLVYILLPMLLDSTPLCSAVLRQHRSVAVICMWIISILKTSLSVWNVMVIDSLPVKQTKHRITASLASV